MRIKLFVFVMVLAILSAGVVYAASGSLATNVKSDAGCEGAFFDLTALSEDITITSFETNQVGTANVRVYYKTGTYAGSETNAGAWTLLGSQTVNGGNGRIQTLYPVDVGSVTIPAGQTYGFLVYSGFDGSSTSLATRYVVGTHSISNSYLSFSGGIASCGGDYSNPFDNSTNYTYERTWRGVIHYGEESGHSGTVFTDGRINRDDPASPFAVFAHQDATGAQGLIFYDAYADAELLAVSAAQIAAIPEYPEQNTLIAASADGRVRLYRLTDGQFQAQGPAINGKEYVVIFRTIGVQVPYESFEQ